MFKHVAGNDFLDQIQCAADLGFRAWEDRGMRSRPVALQQAIARKLQSLDMQMGAFEAVTTLPDLKASGSDTAAEHRVLRDIGECVQVAERVNGRWITIETGGTRIDGGRGQQNQCIKLLKRCCEILEPRELVLVLKPDAGAALPVIEDVHRLCRAVASPACKFLLDVCQRRDVQQELFTCLDRFWPELGYVHCRRAPEPWQPEARAEDGRHVFAHLHARGYSGIVGMEHGNSQPGMAGDWSVVASYVRADRF
jgi:hydroxypyruvate isomerase